MNYAKLNGLIPAVVQDAETSEVPMVGFMNEQALAATRRAGAASFVREIKEQIEKFKIPKTGVAVLS